MRRRDLLTGSVLALLLAMSVGAQGVDCTASQRGDLYDITCETGEGDSYWRQNVVRFAEAVVGIDEIETRFVPEIGGTVTIKADSAALPADLALVEHVGFPDGRLVGLTATGKVVVMSYTTHDGWGFRPGRQLDSDDWKLVVAGPLVYAVAGFRVAVVYEGDVR